MNTFEDICEEFIPICFQQLFLGQIIGKNNHRCKCKGVEGQAFHLNESVEVSHVVLWKPFCAHLLHRFFEY